MKHQKPEVLSELIFENTHTLIAYLDTEFNFVRVNKAYAQADNKEPEFFPGKNHFDLFPNLENQAIFKQVLSTGVPHNAYAKAFEYEHARERGMSHWDWNLHPVKNHEGVIIGLILNLIDVSKRIELEERLKKEERFTNTVLESAGALVIVLDHEGNVVKFNHACERISQFSFHEVVGKPIWDTLLADEEKIDVQRVFSKLTHSGLPNQFINYWVAKNGEKRLLRWSNTVLTGLTGEVEHVISIGVDITEQKAAETALRDSEYRYRFFFETSTVSLWEEDLSKIKHELTALKNEGVVDFEDFFGKHPDVVKSLAQKVKVIDVNRATLSLYEADSKEQLMQNIEVTFTPESFRVFQQGLVAIAEGRSHYQSESTTITLKGSFRHILISFSIPDKEEDFKRILVSLTDINALKVTEEKLKIKERNLAQAQQLAHLGSYCWDLRSGIYEWSDEMYVIHGVDKKNKPMVWDYIDQLIHSDDKTRVKKLFEKTISEHKPIEIEYRIVRPDGNVRYMHAVSESLVEDNCDIRIGFVQDITERKQVEDKIRRMNEELEERVKKRTEDLENSILTIQIEVEERKRTELELKKAKNIADKANQLKSAFLSRMSHELRTPLNAILGFGQLLQQEERHTSSLENANEIIHAGKHLLSLIDEVLDLSKIEAGHVEIKRESVCLKKIVNQCINMVSANAKTHNITIYNNIETQLSLHLYADPERLKEVLANILSNAVKYNVDFGNITIESKVSAENRVAIYISDTGLGIEQEQIKNIFEPFDRLGKESSEIEGTGIGLTISKQLVELMGGKIGVYSNPGEGSTFWIELPLSHSSDNPKIKPDKNLPYTPTISSLFTVLYVEDNPANLRLVENIFQMRPNISLLSATTAESGLMVAQEIQPDLIILDINLPEMNGFQALYELRSYESTKHIPVLALSASAMPADIENGVNAGFKHYLTKPINVNDFLATIDSVLYASNY